MGICWPQGLFIVVVLILGIASMLGGCGQKGPLYLQQKTQAVSVSSTTEAAGENTPGAEHASEQIPQQKSEKKRD